MTTEQSVTEYHVEGVTSQSLMVEVAMKINEQIEYVWIVKKMGRKGHWQMAKTIASGVGAAVSNDRGYPISGIARTRNQLATNPCTQGSLRLLGRR